MEKVSEMQSKALFTFLQDTKDGKYVEVDPNIIEVPRVIDGREDYLFDDDFSVLFSVSNQI